MMAEKEEIKGDEEEAKIPVFTVLKNGAILKNIFIVNKSPPSMSENPDQDYEEILVVGRHPDCNIMLTHPSVSRFHLQIHSNPSSQNLSLIDLSSVHGTWVSEKKVEPGVRVELKEGDTVRVGGSSRAYRLHWVPLSRAYDPFLPSLDVCMTEDKEEENALELDTYEDENSLSVENKEIQSQDSFLESIDSLFSDENLELIVRKEIPSAPLMPESMICDEKEEDEPREMLGSFGTGTESVNLLSFPVGGVILEAENQHFKKENQSPKPPGMEVPQKSNLLGNIGLFSVEDEDRTHPVREIAKETENNIQLGEDNRQKGVSRPLVMETLSLPVRKFAAETNNQQVNKEQKSPQPLLASQSLSDSGKEENSLVEEESNFLVSCLGSACSSEEVNKEQKSSQPLLASQSLSDSGKEENSLVEEESNFLVSCLGSACSSEGAELLGKIESQSGLRKDPNTREISSPFSALVATESVNSSLPGGEVLSDITDNKESQTPQSLFAAARPSEIEIFENTPLRSEKKSNLSSIWSRRGKPSSVLQIQTGSSRGKTRGTGIDAEVELHNQEAEMKLLSKALFSDLHEEGENFTANKENFTPNTLLLESLKKKGKLEETKNSKSCRSSSSKVTFSPNIHLEEDMIASSDKENHTPKVLQERKSARLTSRNQLMLEQEIMPMKRRSERVPFQSLLVNSTGKSTSDVFLSNSATRSYNSVNHNSTMEKKNNSVGEVKGSWTMVVDTTTLLNKESRKSLNLLQGLKGTHLIIPRMVIRELDCLKRRGSLFKRTTEASSVLEWIEECMVKTKTWIHVQSSVEGGRATAPTPPASPQSRYNEGTAGFSCGTASSMPFLSHGSFMDIVSPTAEDHILDCALLYRKMKNDGQLVLLSNDVTLKIKAMAEGLLCETTQEFRESLVNPFSERFMWADSSPRGLTWSHLDDVVLREKYYRCPLKKSAKGEGAKGLKLILLHNSHYGQTSLGS